MHHFLSTLGSLLNPITHSFIIIKWCKHSTENLNVESVESRGAVFLSNNLLCCFYLFFKRENQTKINPRQRRDGKCKCNKLDFSAPNDGHVQYYSRPRTFFCRLEKQQQRAATSRAQVSNFIQTFVGLTIWCVHVFLACVLISWLLFGNSKKILLLLLRI